MRETTALQMERLALPPKSRPAGIQTSAERERERREIEEYLRTEPERMRQRRAALALKKLDDAKKAQAKRKLNDARLKMLDSARAAHRASAVRETRRQLTGQTVHSRRR
jgi:hypothetical protein